VQLEVDALLEDPVHERHRVRARGERGELGLVEGLRVVGPLVDLVEEVAVADRGVADADRRGHVRRAAGPHDEGEREHGGEQQQASGHEG
jgi:hypothetical protein